MFETFSWMFKNEKFNEHIRYLILTLFKFFIPAIILSLVLYFFYQIISPIALLVLFVITALLYAAPFLCLQGYFWELAGNIISREWDIKAANIYNGKIKNVYKITLPEIHTLKFIWRGIASIVANMLMGLPLIVLIFFSTLLGLLGGHVLGTDMFTNPSYYLASLISLILYWFLVPAFLWNYANRDSVVAVWNLRKAVYIAGNYTGKYILNSTIFCIYYIAVTFIVYCTKMFLFIGKFDITNLIYLINLILISIFSYFIYMYSIYVYAYLLGTIAPPHEG